MAALKEAHLEEMQRLEETAMKDAESAAELVRTQLGTQLEAATGKLAKAEKQLASLLSDLEVCLPIITPDIYTPMDGIFWT